MCMAAGIDPPAQVQVHGWLLVGGEKMSKSSVNQISPGDLMADYGVDPVRYHLLRDTPLGSDGDFSAEGIDCPLQRRPGQQPGQPAGPGGHRGRLQVRWHRSCARQRQPAGLGGRRRWCAEATAAWNESLPHLGLEATWRLIRETNAELETAEPWKSEPGPAVDAVLGSALEVLRIVALLVVAGHAGHGRRDLASHRARAGARRTSRLPEAGDVGSATPAASRWRRRRPCSRGGRRDGRLVTQARRDADEGESGEQGGKGEGGTMSDAVLEWFDSHCHLQDEYLTRRPPKGRQGRCTPHRWRQRWPGPRRPGSPGWSASAPGLGHPSRSRGPGSQACDDPARRLGSRASRPGPRWDCIPTTPRRGRRRRSSPRRRSEAPMPREPRSWWPWGSAGSTTTTTIRPGTCSGRHSPAQVELAHRHGLALVIHTREAWDDTFDILAGAGVPERTVVHCFTGGPAEARRCLDLGRIPLVQRDRHLQDRR